MSPEEARGLCGPLGGNLKEKSAGQAEEQRKAGLPARPTSRPPGPRLSGLILLSLQNGFGCPGTTDQPTQPTSARINIEKRQA